MKKIDPAWWQGSTPPSLVQQRMEIDRVRTHGLFGIWGGSVLLALWIAQLAFREFDALDMLQVALAAIFIGMGIREIARHRRSIAAFEVEHGEGVGRQDALR